MLISQERLSASLSRSGYRQEMARARARRQKAWFTTGAVVLGGLLVVWAAAKLAVRNAPSAPRLTVAWPSVELGSAVLSSGATLLTRSGQPLWVGVENPNDWNLWIRDGGATLQDSRVRWSPAGDAETLVLECRPILKGWRLIGLPLAPLYKLSLQGLRAARLEDGRLTLRATTRTKGTEVFVSSQVQAGAGTTWDERALPLLDAAARALTPAQPLIPGEARWTLASSFDASKAAGDDATYAILNEPQQPGKSNAETLAKLAREIAKRAPQASIKLVGGSATNKDVTLSAIRLAFDGTGTRAGWQKAPGEAAGRKWRWWEDAANGDTSRRS